MDNARISTPVVVKASPVNGDSDVKFTWLKCCLKHSTAPNRIESKGRCRCLFREKQEGLQDVREHFVSVHHNSLYFTHCHRGVQWIGGCALGGHCCRFDTTHPPWLLQLCRSAKATDVDISARTF